MKPVRAIAFYLPQFHPIPENDAWWGKGFTEWANVVKGEPLFDGHYQPHLPADLGFYDLRVPEVRMAQADLAREYGIHGFCYYHYWFNGRRLLERPLNEVLAGGKPDFPFCVCWANENWTRRWDGLEREVLVEQVYSKEDDLEHFQALLPMFRDPRYIKVEGKPFFLIYRILKFPDPAATVQLWREEAVKAGLPGLYLANVECLGEDHGAAATLPLDAAVEFAPDWTCLGEPMRLVAAKNSREPGASHRVFSYEKIIENMREKPRSSYLRYPCVTPMWDNAARRKENATILAGSTPDLYEEWLKDTVRDFVPPSAEENFVFINAWNEWAEGSHLEPCQKWKRAYLQATQRALTRVKEKIGSSKDETILRTVHAVSVVEDLPETDSRLEAKNAKFEPPPISTLSDSVGPRPFWSVMIPTYNARTEFLQETLRSILQQDPGPDQMQIEIVDDCSPEGPPVEVVRAVAADRVAIYRETKNQGLAGIWNRCIERARGEWVHILHQDDTIQPGFYTALRKGMRDRQVGAVFSRHAFMNPDGNWTEIAPLQRDSAGIPDNWAERMALGQPIQCASIIVRRDVYERLGGFLPQLKYALDWEMWQRIAAHYAFWFEPAVLASYRGHPASATSRLTLSGGDTRDIAQMIEIVTGYYPPSRSAALAEMARAGAAGSAIQKGRRLLVEGHPEAAWKQIGEAFRLSRKRSVFAHFASFLVLWARIQGSRLKRQFKNMLSLF